MKFIHSDGHDPVDIQKVEFIAKGKSDIRHKIVFNFNRGSTTWFFQTEKERDKTYEKVLTAIESQNISNITTL
jgi:hypothetical protein